MYAKVRFDALSFYFIMKRMRAKMKMTTLCRMIYINKNIVPAYL